MNKPIFPINTQESVKITPKSTTEIIKVKQKHVKVRWDKVHSMKFPVSVKQETEIRKLWKKHKRTLEMIENRYVSITKFNTMLLRFGLRNLQLIREQPYQDSGTYKTVKPNQIEYEMIGGPDGLAIEWTVSERRALAYIMESVLSYLRSGGELDFEKIQPIKPSE